MSQVHANPPSDTPPEGEGSLASAAVCIQSPLNSIRVVETAREMSKKGKLPGFEAGQGALFIADAHGKPFDSVIEFHATSDNDGCVLETRVRLKRTMPWVFGVVTALSIWPGVLLTDSLMNSWFGWYPNETWVTYAWYMPLTVLPLPWMVRRVMKQSRASADEHAAETIEKIAKAVSGAIVPRG